jgi:hypothetical protein
MRARLVSKSILRADRAAFAFLIALTALGTPTQAAVVDFEGSSSSLTELGSWGHKYSNGLNFTTNFYHYTVDPTYNYYLSNGTDYYMSGYYGLTITAGGLFGISTLDAGLADHTDIVQDVTFTGYKSGGGTVTQTLRLSPEAFATFTLVGFSNLTSLVIGTTDGYIALDNIFYSSADSVNQTPIPGALPLFASALGLGGLFRYRRKRKAAMRAL